MSEITDQPFPRGALISAAVMIGVAVSLTAIVRLSGADISSPVPASPAAVRLLQFVDRDGGAVAVYDASEHRAITVVAPGTNGFMRATMRNFARERRSYGIGAEAPFRLSASPDGRLVLKDLATGRQVDLEAFGPTNAGVFAQLLQRSPPGDRP